MLFRSGDTPTVNQYCQLFVEFPETCESAASQTGEYGEEGHFSPGKRPNPDISSLQADHRPPAAGWRIPEVPAGVAQTPASCIVSVAGAPVPG